MYSHTEGRDAGETEADRSVAGCEEERPSHFYICFRQRFAHDAKSRALFKWLPLLRRMKSEAD